MAPPQRKQASEYPQEVLTLFDGYVHGALSRRDFLERAAKYAIGGLTALALLESLSPNFAWAQEVAKTDPRIIGSAIVQDQLHDQVRARRAIDEVEVLDDARVTKGG